MPDQSTDTVPVHAQGRPFPWFCPILLWGKFGPHLTDGLLDPGADRTLLDPKLARRLGINVDSLPRTIVLQSALRQIVECKVTALIFQSGEMPQHYLAGGGGRRPSAQPLRDADGRPNLPAINPP